MCCDRCPGLLSLIFILSYSIIPAHDLLGVQTTGEAQVTSMIESNGFDPDSGLLSPVENILRKAIDKHLCPNDEDDTADQCFKRKKTKLIDALDTIDFPCNPIDVIINHFGVKAVAEMTGRKHRIVKSSSRGIFTYQNRSKKGSSPDAVNIQERKCFMEGSKLIAIISEAASTGISLHADKRALNNRRRFHLTIEVSLSCS